MANSPRTAATMLFHSKLGWTNIALQESAVRPHSTKLLN